MQVIKKLFYWLFKKQRFLGFIIPAEQAVVLIDKAKDQKIPVELYLAAILESYLEIIREVRDQPASPERIQQVFQEGFEKYQAIFASGISSSERNANDFGGIEVSVPISCESYQRLKVLLINKGWDSREALLHGLLMYKNRYLPDTS